MERLSPGSSIQKVSEIFFYAQAPDFEAKPITHYEGDIGVGLGSLTFSPDGKSLVFVRGNSKNTAGEAANPAQLQENTDFKIHLIDLETGENRLLSEGSGPVFSPDSKSIIFRKGRDLHQLGLGENETSSPVFKARGSIISYAFSPDGRWISFVSHRSTHSYVGLWDRQNAKLTYPETSLDHDSYPSWSPDGKSLAYLRIPNVTNKLPFTAHREANPWSIRILDLESMKAKEVWAADPGDGSVVVRDLPAEADRLWWTADGSLIFPWEKDRLGSIICLGYKGR